MKMALVRNYDGLVMNLIVAEPDDPVPQGYSLVSAEDEPEAVIGGIYTLLGGFRDPEMEQEAEAVGLDMDVDPEVYPT